jgi:hypothetical protein
VSLPVSIVFIVIFITNWVTAGENGVVVKFLVAGRGPSGKESVLLN